MNKYLDFMSLGAITMPKDDKYLLLAYYADDTKYNISEEIEFLEKIKAGETGYDYKTWQVQDTSFGNGAGTLDFQEVLSDGLVYLESSDESQAESMFIDIDELIDVLKEFRQFLIDNNSED